MKRIMVIAAGLGYRTLEKNRLLNMAGLKFTAAESVFPALTCVHQASLRTGLESKDHGILFNGVWAEDFKRPFFWEQSSAVVKGSRLWGKSTGLFFMQQSLGENVDLIVSPAPIHKHGGGMITGSYTRPTELERVLKRLCGEFPLWRYWGPLAHAKVGRKCIAYFEAATSVFDVDEAFIYLPTLDYAFQRSGPDSSAARAALRELRRQLERLADIAMRRGCELKVLGDYEISAVEKEPLRPNAVLRRNGLMATRTIKQMAYPDFFQSKAFAVCDHEIAVVYGEERERAKELLLSTGDYEDAGEVLVARKGSWCSYEWWNDAREAPDYARHVDIHSKPGFDPKELFFRCQGSVKGTHGRRSTVAITEV